MLLISVVGLTLLLSQRTFSAALDPALEETWRDWRAVHAKEYPEGEEDFRRAIWEENLRMIEQHNREASLGKHSYTLGMNHFGDLTNEEFNQLNGFLPDLDEQGGGNETAFQASAALETPTEVDWRTKGYVTPVKYQGRCGSCWAFSATGALEGLLFKKTGNLVPLSEQNLVDCSSEQGNNGCAGGYPNKAFLYVMDNNGINSEDDYPYEERNGLCRYNKSNVVAQCTGYVRIEKGSMIALEQAVANVGPISVALDMRSRAFQFYKSGVFYLDGCGKTLERLNHAMLVVGYGTSQKGPAYWILKNSFSDAWGEKGYMRLAKGVHNNCGVATYATFPIVY